MRELWEAELTSSMLAFHQYCQLCLLKHLIGQLQRKSSKSCQRCTKLVTNHTVIKHVLNSTTRRTVNNDNQKLKPKHEFKFSVTKSLFLHRNKILWDRYPPGICSSCLLVIGAILVDVEPKAPFLVLSTLQHKQTKFSVTSFAFCHEDQKTQNCNVLLMSLPLSSPLPPPPPPPGPWGDIPYNGLYREALPCLKGVPFSGWRYIKG